MTQDDETVRKGAAKTNQEDGFDSSTDSNQSAIRTAFDPLITAFAFLTQFPVANHARFDEENHSSVYLFLSGSRVFTRTHSRFGRDGIAVHFFVKCCNFTGTVSH